MKRSLQRLGAGAAAVALATVPGVATADQAAVPVDKKTGPVAYAIPAAYKLPQGTYNDPAMSRALQVTRSALRPGAVEPPNNAKTGYPYVDSLAVTAERGSADTYITISDDQYVPAKIKDTEGPYVVKAGLTDRLIPVAHIEGDFSVTAWLSNEDAPAAKYGKAAVLYLNNVVSHASCSATDKLRAVSKADGVWVLQANGTMAKVEIAAGESYTVKGMPIQAPGINPQGVEDHQLRANVTITHVTEPSGLLKPEGFRLGEYNAAAGWRVDTEYYWVGEKKQHPMFSSSMLISAVSCSLPKDFKALPGKEEESNKDDKTSKPDNAGQDKTSSNGNGSTDDEEESQVPVHIPSGGAPIDEQSGLLIGVGAMSAMVIGSAGALAYRRRNAAASAD